MYPLTLIRTNAKRIETYEDVASNDITGFSTVDGVRFYALEIEQDTNITIIDNTVHNVSYLTVHGIHMEMNSHITVANNVVRDVWAYTELVGMFAINGSSSIFGTCIVFVYYI